MTETTVTDVDTGGRSGKGSAPSTIAVLNFDPTLGCDPATFQPCSDRALSTLKVIGDAFAKSFAFTQNLPPDSDQLNPFFGWYLEEKLLGGHVRLSISSFAGMQWLNHYRLSSSRRNISGLYTPQSSFSTHS